MQDLRGWGWDWGVGRALVSRVGEDLPWELPEGRHRIFTVSSTSSTGIRAGSEVFGGLN